MFMSACWAAIYSNSDIGNFLQLILLQGSQSGVPCQSGYDQPVRVPQAQHIVLSGYEYSQQQIR